ncbi:TetR/AcrR family transcriptional regulator [Roseibium sp.]|uniref:TetR/AcrR family transcriptional regulator n=1 Tax=Roseibium sp. TaxID=1936156 RepID=UPI003A97566A
MRPSKRDELVREALKVFYRGGFHATGMDALVAATGISKTTMFKHFSSKEELILAVLRLRDENFRNWIIRRVEERASSPRGRLLALFDVLAEWFEQPDFRGCMFIKASGEYQDPDHPIHAQSAEHKRLLFKYFDAVARQAGAKRPGDLARQLLLLKEGSIIAKHMGYEVDPAGDAKAAARTLLEDALGPEAEAA